MGHWTGNYLILLKSCLHIIANTPSEFQEGIIGEKIQEAERKLLIK